MIFRFLSSSLFAPRAESIPTIPAYSTLARLLPAPLPSSSYLYLTCLVADDERVVRLAPMPPLCSPYLPFVLLLALRLVSACKRKMIEYNRQDEARARGVVLPKFLLLVLVRILYADIPRSSLVYVSVSLSPFSSLPLPSF